MMNNVILVEMTKIHRGQRNVFLNKASFKDSREFGIFKVYLFEKRDSCSENSRGFYDFNLGIKGLHCEVHVVKTLLSKLFEKLVGLKQVEKRQFLLIMMSNEILVA
jgi:hypothetical protein